MNAVREKKRARTKTRKLAYMYQNLIWWTPWIELENADKLASDIRVPRLPEGLNYMSKRWSTKGVLRLTAFASDWQWKSIIPSQVTRINSVWTKYVHRRMGLIRETFINISSAASYGWWCYTNGADNKTKVMTLSVIVFMRANTSVFDTQFSFLVYSLQLSHVSTAK